MNFQEIAKNLPNGFHDAGLRKIHIDYIGQSVEIELDILVGGPDEPDPELYRPAKLRVAPVYFVLIEPPDPRYDLVPQGKSLTIDGDEIRPGDNKEVDRLMLTIPKDAVFYRFFVVSWNAFLYLAGADVEFKWAEGN